MKTQRSHEQLRVHPPASPTPTRETVLVAEDQDAVRAVVKRVLAGRGYDVLIASNGEEAVALAESYPGPIHLLVSDMVMPRMGGVALVEKLRAARPNLKVILMSGSTETSDSRFDNLSASISFLEKPFSVDQLSDLVRAMLDSSGSRA